MQTAYLKTEDRVFTGLLAALAVLPLAISLGYLVTAVSASSRSPSGLALPLGVVLYSVALLTSCVALYAGRAWGRSLAFWLVVLGVPGFGALMVHIFSPHIPPDMAGGAYALIAQGIAMRFILPAGVIAGVAFAVWLFRLRSAFDGV